jgi:hypothetical protein
MANPPGMPSSPASSSVTSPSHRSGASSAVTPSSGRSVDSTPSPAPTPSPPTTPRAGSSPSSSSTDNSSSRCSTGSSGCSRSSSRTSVHTSPSTPRPSPRTAIPSATRRGWHARTAGETRTPTSAPRPTRASDGTAREIAADKADDTLECNSQPFDDHGIRPVIDIRDLWKQDKTRPLIPDRVDSFIHDEKGNVSCVCPTTGETRKLSFCGFEKDRGTLEYRCPATAQGFVCRGRAECEARACPGRFGRVVRVPIERNRRSFTPIPRNTRRWVVAYARRTAVERVNSRLDQVLGFERHFIRGQAKMQVRVTLAGPPGQRRPRARGGTCLQEPSHREGLQGGVTPGAGDRSVRRSGFLQP